MDEYLWKMILDYLHLNDVLNLRATCNELLMCTMGEQKTYDGKITNDFIHIIESDIYKDILFRNKFVYKGKDKLLVNSNNGNIYYVMIEIKSPDELRWIYDGAHWGNIYYSKSNILEAANKLLMAVLRRKVSDIVCKINVAKFHGRRYKYDKFDDTFNCDI